MPRDKARWDCASGTFTAPMGSARFQKRVVAQLFDAFWRHRNRAPFANLNALYDAAFSNDLAGGPDINAASYVYLKRIRELIEPLGFTITRNRGCPRMGLKLVPLQTSGTT